MLVMCKRMIRMVLILLFLNIPFVIHWVEPFPIISIFISVVLFIYFVYINIRPGLDNPPHYLKQKRLHILSGGCELMLAAAVGFTLEVIFYMTTIFLPAPKTEAPVWVANTVLVVLALLVLLLNGIIRVFVSSGQLGLTMRLLLLFLWWVPVINIVLLRRFFRAARMEYTFTSQRNQLNDRRKSEAVCKTKYPLLMVHGIFFRDWELFNYWGRIPNELINNGATVFYGGQQSAVTVEQSAEELRRRILRIVEETGCEKVNIIAHSKGGLDSRYAISCLGMAPYVASLTTINTPHHGCNYVDRLLELIPQRTVKKIGKSYNTLFTVLGDSEPDFFRGLSGLTDSACATLNQLMPDQAGVLYRSVGSKMRSAASAMFPLNLGYSLIKRLEGDNDGLVSTASMEWGEFLGVICPGGRKGISHGDVIDLTRKNIPGFDVCEFYIDLAYTLKQRGL